VFLLSGLNLSVAMFRLALAWMSPEPDEATHSIACHGVPATVLPRYTVMVPMYREAHVLPALVRSIGGLDYPADKIEIFLVCEADDPETLAAAETAAWSDPRFRAIAVPACLPRTKPKALNYALCFARGELLVIYDAEDRPDRDQLLKAARTFADGPPELACVQARLNWYNKDHNWLTRAFALEYALWFDYMLPGLQRMGAPLPLGGTSNHFKTEALIRAGAWDPFNVTEDADLGLRFMRQGGAVATLDSTTLEEATCTTSAWVRQRSRWIKGYMQTWLVQMRDPARLWRAAGPKGFVGFQLFIGGVPATALANPILWLLTLISLAFWAMGRESPIPGFGEAWAVCSLLIGNLGLVYLNMLCALRRRWLDLVPVALLTPIYWVLISIAGYKALVQLIVNPFYWEKTEHGVAA
jgi:cellulose synthase/poly-beta-1,6-N-acetylglucosamine synthase-like glycosyltransferase